ncbi:MULTISPECIES: hypothetical protein [unclassified Fibrobacter]|uniref:hypothetical protein n=1 Tax=unclassified Fibrobacter TaxID=2634177 RepID=UPI0025BBA2F9|nr:MULTISPECIES: hypothetical protein [unclassified Fibrobacter]
MRFFYLTVLAFLIALSGCTMHPPSASGFMESLELSREGENNRVYTARLEKINFSMQGNEWEIPLGLETTKGYANGFVTGWGLLPSPYFMFGQGNKYFAWRTWVSAIWLGITVALVCETGACDDDGDSDSYSHYDDEYDDYDYVAINSLLDAWMELFSGGFSVIEQIPIGDFIRIGFEQYICRNFWLNLGWIDDQLDFGNVEVGVGSYVSFRLGAHRISLDARYGILDFNPKKPRLSIGLSYSNSILFGSAPATAPR